MDLLVFLAIICVVELARRKAVLFIGRRIATPTQFAAFTGAVTDHTFEGGAVDAYCSKCGRAYFCHR